MPRQHASLRAAIGLLALIASACLPSPDPPSSAAPPSPGPNEAAAADRRPIIIDADFDQSDISAIAVLLRDPAIDVRAIAIDGTGLVHCQGGRLVARYLLDEFGVSDIPFGCGRENGGPDARPFPDDWRVTADAGYGLDITPRVEPGAPLDAVEVIRAAVDSSKVRPTIVALGPWTNLEDAFAADPTLPDRIAGIHAMLGVVDAPGNVYVDGFDGDAPLEWNAFADPSAVEAVLATDVPVDLIPLDATDDVPVPADLAERLADDHAAAGADLTYELLVRHPARLAADEGQQLWDELAALTVSSPALVTWSDATVVVGDGGRLTRDAAGRPVRYASAADRVAVEAALLTALRRGEPRATPFQLAGSLTATWDGTTCTLAGDAVRPGFYGLTYTGSGGRPTGVLIAGVRAPRTWADLTAFVAALDLETMTGIPDWLIQGGEAADEGGSGAPVATTATLETGTFGPICLEGEWPDLTFTPGQSFDVAG